MHHGMAWWFGDGTIEGMVRIMTPNHQYPTTVSVSARHIGAQTLVPPKLINLCIFGINPKGHNIVGTKNDNEYEEIDDFNLADLILET